MTQLLQDSFVLRSEAELIADQLAGIDAWNTAARTRTPAKESVVLTREMRLDLTRRMQARRREQAALMARAQEHLEQSAHVLGARVQPRAVLVHRNAWLREKVADRLAERGVLVVAQLEDGADAAGALVVEQPELVLVEDRLPTLSGLQVLARAARFAPRTLAAAQLLDGSSVSAYVDAGARAVFTRRIPPREIADELLSCLAGAGRATVRV